jgi:hypothetical protein
MKKILENQLRDKLGAYLQPIADTAKVQIGYQFPDMYDSIS